MKRLMLLVTALVFGLATNAGATNGYFTHGCGTQYKALGGGGSALSLSSLGNAKNPASMVWVGDRYDVGVALFNPNRQYTVNGNPSGFPGTFGLAPGTVESGTDAFMLPSAGANWMLDEVSSFGLGIYGNGGMNTDYDAATFGVLGAGVDMAQVFVAPTYARRVGEHSFGASAILAYQRFEGRGLAAFAPFSSDVAALSDNEHANSWGFGARFGYLGHVTPFLSLAGSYQTRTWMSEFDEYAGLFAEGGDFDIPQNFTLGLAVEPIDHVAVVFDFERIFYSEVNSVGNQFMPNFMNEPLGMENAAGFGWDDTNVYKTGIQWRAPKNWTLRGGYSYADQPIPEEEVLFNIVAPGVVQQHVTGGFSKALSDHHAVHFTAMRALSDSVEGSNPLEAPDQQSIEIEMNQWEFELSFSLLR